jgi:hypothetical protein
MVATEKSKITAEQIVDIKKRFITGASPSVWIWRHLRPGFSIWQALHNLRREYRCVTECVISVTKQKSRFTGNVLRERGGENLRKPQWLAVASVVTARILGGQILLRLQFNIGAMLRICFGFGEAAFLVGRAALFMAQS